MKTSIIVILFLMIFGMSDLNAAAKDAESKNIIINVAETDKEMNKAIKEARDSLALFIKKFKSPSDDESNFALKVKIEDSYGVEHFWVTSIDIKGNSYSGIISNDARTVKSVKLGDVIKFSNLDISDWSYDKKNVRQGSYTLKVLLKRMPKEQADYYRSIIGW